MKRLIFIAIVVSLPFLAFAQDPISEAKADDLFNDGLVLLAHQQPGAAYDRFSEFLKESHPSDPRRKDAEYYTILTGVNLFHADGEKRIKDFTSQNEGHPRSASAFTTSDPCIISKRTMPRPQPILQRQTLQPCPASNRTVDALDGDTVFSHRRNLMRHWNNSDLLKALVERLDLLQATMPGISSMPKVIMKTH